MATPTDVSTAQSFDYSAFFGNLLNTGASLAVQKIAPTQNTGVPSATTTPNLSANPAGNTVPASAGVSSQTLAMLGIGAALVVGLALIVRK